MPLRANAAAVDNIGLFFGEDVFIAIGSILLIKSFLEQNGFIVEPRDLVSFGQLTEEVFGLEPPPRAPPPELAHPSCGMTRALPMHRSTTTT